MSNNAIESWKQIHESRDWGEWPSIDVVRFISRRFPGNQNQEYKILDFGCGTGANTWFMARKGFECYAFDCSESAIKKAEKKIAGEKVNGTVHFSVADGAALKYADEFFDCVVDGACIYCNTIDRIMHIYEDVYRMMKPGAYLYSTMFSIGTTGYQTGTEIEKNTFSNLTEGPMAGQGTIHFYESSEEIKEILETVGFSNIEIDTTKYTDCGNVIEYYMVSCVK